jgi:urease beta subunit
LEAGGIGGKDEEKNRERTHLVAIILNFGIRVVQVSIHAHHFVEHGALGIHT